MTPWTRLPRAARLLASCAKNPPATRVLPYRFGETRTVYTKADPRVRALRSLYKNAQPPVDGPGWSDWVSSDEQVAIREALSRKAERRAA